jgi:aromatase
MRIRWTYREVDGGIEMRWVQQFQMRPDAPVNDEAMTQHINRNSAIQMARIKGLVEQAAQARPEAAAAAP